MGISSEQKGRRLVLTVETGDDEPAIAPFIIPPVSVAVGRRLTGLFLLTAAKSGALTPDDQEMMFQVALDGGSVIQDEDGEDFIGVPRDEAGGALTPNYTRSGLECTQSEQEELFWKAFLWQSVLGHEGIAVFDEVGGGTAGMLKTTRLLMVRKGIELEPQMLPTQQAGPRPKPSNTDDDGEPLTGLTRNGSPTVAKLPKGKKSIKQNR